jgi:hypothetical protein
MFIENFFSSGARFFNIRKDIQDPEKNREDLAPVLPELDSPCRKPNYKYKMRVDNKGTVFNPFVVCMLKAYGYEAHTNSVVLLGDYHLTQESCCIFFSPL